MVHTTDAATGPHPIQLLSAHTLLVEQEITSGSSFRRQRRHGGRMVHNGELRSGVGEQRGLEAATPREPFVVALLVDRVTDSTARHVMLWLWVAQQEIMGFAAWQIQDRPGGLFGVRFVRTVVVLGGRGRDLGMQSPMIATGRSRGRAARVRLSTAHLVHQRHETRANVLHDLGEEWGRVDRWRNRLLVGLCVLAQ